MASSIRILSSRDVDSLLPHLDTHKLIDVHTARLFRTLAIANLARSKSDADTGIDTDATDTDTDTDTNRQIRPAFVDSPHRLAVQTGRGRGCGGTMLVMPSSVANYGTTVKLLCVPTVAVPNSSHPTTATTTTAAEIIPAATATAATKTSMTTTITRPAPATTVVIDQSTGAVKAVVNARALNFRTALGE
jgi:hypothetical protein